ncbi:MAG TPA: hypothetical protein VLI90_20200 [Tepidisphaeraceae bacterium]|nr:hypothetical protein [Tepidisphaeraceae bacterium]
MQNAELKIIFIVFILHSAFIVLPSARADTVAPSTTQSATTEFVSPEFRFRLRHPAQWTRPEHPVNDQVFSVRTPDVAPGDHRFGVVGLKIDNGPEGQSDAATLLELSDSIAAYVFKGGAQHVTVKPDKIGVANILARRVRFVTEQPSGKIATMYVIAVRKRTEYVFNIAAPVELFDTMLPGVDELLKSFELIE